MINEGKTVEVNFGDVLSTRVDGLNYKRLVDYHPSCEQMPINTLKLSVEGMVLFDANALMTNITGLGIRILYQNKPIKLGQAINFYLSRFFLYWKRCLCVIFLYSSCGRRLFYHSDIAHGISVRR